MIKYIQMQVANSIFARHIKEQTKKYRRKSMNSRNAETLATVERERERELLFI